VGKVMYSLKLDPKDATLAHVRRELDLDPSEIDADFGVVSIDPDQDLYTILVDERAVTKLGAKADVQGPFANPRIEPFGPPKS
jgi:hypothetical protein